MDIPYEIGIGGIPIENDSCLIGCTVRVSFKEVDPKIAWLIGYDTES